jgi:hypothetical protein
MVVCEIFGNTFRDEEEGEWDGKERRDKDERRDTSWQR